MHPLLALPGLDGMLRRLSSAPLAWAEASQQHARRNALIAHTALTQRRIERDQVEDFLAVNDRRWQARTASLRAAL